MTTDDRTDHQSPRYEIRVQGRLATRWSTWFDGMTIAADDDGTTVICGPVVDQAALHGLLQKLRDVGLPLISLTPATPGGTTPGKRPEPTKGTDMHTLTRTTPTGTTPTRKRMDPLRRTAFVAGLLYLATFVFSMPAAFGFYNSVLHNHRFVLGAGSVQGVFWGGLFEILTGLAGIGTAVVLYPVAKRYSRNGAMGFLASRILEASIITVGVLSLLSIVTLRQDLAGAHAPGLVTVARSLVALKNWTFLLGPGFMSAINGICLGVVMYRSRLVPRIIPTIGLIGAPLLLASSVGTLFGLHDQVSATASLMALPIAAWEFSLGMWMMVKGFTTTPADGSSAR